MPPSGADYSLNAESSIRYLFSVSASAFIAWLTGRELTCDSFVRNLWQWGSSQHTVNANLLCTKALLGSCWFRICIYGADYTEADYLSVTNKVTNTHWSLYTSTEAVITDQSKGHVVVASALFEYDSPRGTYITHPKDQVRPSAVLWFARTS